MTPFTFPYTQGSLTVTVTAKPYIRHGNVYADIDSVMYNGCDVYALLESFDCLDDVLATAERKAGELYTVAED